jgi:hypothetical protein
MWTGSLLAYGETLRNSAIVAARFLHRVTMRPHVLKIATTGKGVMIDTMSKGLTIEVMGRGVTTETTVQGVTAGKCRGLTTMTTNKTKKRRTPPPPRIAYTACNGVDRVDAVFDIAARCGFLFQWWARQDIALGLAAAHLLLFATVGSAARPRGSMRPCTRYRRVRVINMTRSPKQNGRSTTDCEKRPCRAHRLIPMSPRLPLGS